MKRLLFILFCFLTNIVFAGDVEFTASVSKNVVALDEGFTLSFTLNTSGKNFRAPELSENFKIYSGPNQSRSMSIVNNSVSSTLTYSYTLFAINVGDFVIEPAQIEVDGKKYSSNPIKIKVVKAKNPQKKSAKGNQQSLQQQLGKNLYLKLELSKTKAFIGEQILATYKLYNRANLAGIAGEKLPEFVGFYTQEIEIDGHNNHSREVVQGIIYDVYTLKKTILFPQKTGKLELKPLTIDATVRVKEKEPINTWFGPQYRYQNKAVKIKSRTRYIKVSPTPSPKPKSFKGAVGKFKLSASIDKNAVKSNEAINLKIKIKGTGNINLAEVLMPEFPTDFEVYDPKTNVNTNKKSNQLSGSKTLEYLIIPRHSGDFELDPIEFTYFDPAKKQYITEKSESFKIHVDKSDDEDEVAYVRKGQSQKNVQQIGSDIRYIKLGQPELGESGIIFYRSFWFYFFIILPMIILSVIYYFQKKYSDMTSDKVGMKKRRANKIAAKHLREAEKLLKEGNTNQFYDAVSKAIYGYLGDKLNMSISDLSKENIANELQKKGIDQSIIQILSETLDQCEMARFAPSAVGSPETIFDNASQVITKIEGQLK